MKKQINQKPAKLLTALGSDAEIAAAIGERKHVVRDWRLRGSIPLNRWPSLYPLGLTAEQLLQAHDALEDAA